MKLFNLCVLIASAYAPVAMAWSPDQVTVKIRSGICGEKSVFFGSGVMFGNKNVCLNQLQYSKFLNKNTAIKLFFL